MEFAQKLPAALVFWRSLARQFFQAVCQLGEGGFQKWQSVAASAEEVLAAEAPPMRGLEYLNARQLRMLWNELRQLAVSRAAALPEGPTAWLRSVNPLWHLLGRVTFHLAENKRDLQCPLAFLATNTNTVSAQAKLQHLPLAEALKNYAEAKDQQKLELLLVPVHQAAERSPLVAELLQKRSLFSPQAWTVREAHRFLTESPAMEAAGVGPSASGRSGMCWFTSSSVGGPVEQGGAKPADTLVSEVVDLNRAAD